MANKTEIKHVLKELGKTEKEMQAYCDELLETNKTVQMINRDGKTWRDMHYLVIEDLPTQKQRDIEQLEKAKLYKEQVDKEKVDKEVKNKYYEEKDAYDNSKEAEEILNELDKAIKNRISKSRSLEAESDTNEIDLEKLLRED